jgi:predicted Rossmann fold flavoprotein
MPKPLIIGAGAAGLLAGVVAARRGLKPLLWEKNPKPGRKLAATGNGRGNYTNAHILPQHYHSSTPKMLPAILAGYDSDWAVEFFRQLGIEPFVESDGRIFPASQSAESLVEVLVREILEHGGEIVTGDRVLAIKHGDGHFTVKGSKAAWEGQCLLLATGGEAHPQLGSSGEGYAWAKALGLDVIPPYPVLVPLLLSDGFRQKLQGVKVLCSLMFYKGDKLIKTTTGEALFTSFGLSGPAALELSGYISELGLAGSRIELDLRPDEEITATGESLRQRLDIHSKRSLANALVGLLPRRLIPQLLLKSSMDPGQNAGNLPKAGRQRLVEMLRRTPLAISGVADWTKAQVTGGGVALNEISPSTFAVNKQPGLFLAGEIVDVWGESGGYNLHFAWMSGCKAGENLF